MGLISRNELKVEKAEKVPIFGEKSKKVNANKFDVFVGIYKKHQSKFQAFRSFFLSCRLSIVLKQKIFIFSAYRKRCFYNEFLMVKNHFF
jgi:hypothetical protein